jgi:hypothetical protein
MVPEPELLTRSLLAPLLEGSRVPLTGVIPAVCADA